MLKSPCLFGYSALCCFCETFFTREEGERGYKHKEYADHFGYFRGFNMPLFVVVWALGKIKEAPIGVFRLLKMPPFLPNMEPKSNSFLEISCY